MPRKESDNKIDEFIEKIFYGVKGEAPNDDRKDEDRRDGTSITMPDDIKYVSLYTFLLILQQKWHKMLAVLVACTLICEIIMIIPQLYTVKTVMSLNYAESAKGKTPNGVRYNVSELRSPAVAELALQKAGLSDSVDAKTLISAISITPYTNRNVVSASSYYISSSYYLTFNKPVFGMGDISAQDMLDMLCRAYKEFFYENYILTTKALDFDESSLEDMEYEAIGNYVVMVSQRVEGYLNMRTNSSGGAFTDSDGNSFKGLQQRIQNLRNYQIPTYRSYIWENGIAKDKEYAISNLEYSNSNLERDYEKNIRNSNVRREIVDLYSQSMSSSILIPTIDSTQSFYMARTKTGIDDISTAADSFLTAAEANLLSIKKNEDRIEKLKRTKVKSQYDKANKLIDAICASLDEIVESVSNLDDAFTTSQTRNYVSFRNVHKSLLGMLKIKEIAIFDILIFVLMYVFFVRQRKEEARQELKKVMRATYNFGDDDDFEGDGDNT